MAESDSNFGASLSNSGIDIDPAFALIPKNKTCLCIWRVEVCLWNLFDISWFIISVFVVKNFKLVAVSRESHGIFFKGDAYVIYHAEEIKKSSHSSTSLSSSTSSTLTSIAATSSGTTVPLVQHIHFWIGCEATQDEAGVAAYKTVELGRMMTAPTPMTRQRMRTRDKIIRQTWFVVLLNDFIRSTIVSFRWLFDFYFYWYLPLT
jgi:hypothetical protein